jgi:hypothetical protein
LAIAAIIITAITTAATPLALSITKSNKYTFAQASVVNSPPYIALPPLLLLLPLLPLLLLLLLPPPLLLKLLS